MKKTIALITALLVAMMLTACGGEKTASDAVKTWLDNFKTQDAGEAMKAFGGSIAGFDTDQLETFVKKVQEFDYEILDEKVAEDGKSATVKVKIKTYDFGSAMEKFYDELMEGAKSGKLKQEDFTQEKIQKKLIDTFNGVKDKDFSAEVSIECKLKDGEWVPVFEGQPEFMDAVFGGFISKAAKIGAGTGGAAAS